MKKFFLAALLTVSLSGCNYYNLEDVEKSKQACAELDGKFTAGIDNSQGVWITYCTVDSIRYSYRRADGAFINGAAK
ncbi:hypothetical protein 16Q_079 [Pseudomonas phage 16Q]|nr:hypothetical protein 16Q_079 [Pseudomonas phage 16Q]